MKNLLHRLFIPSENNNYQSKVLHTDFLTYCLILVIFVAFVYQKTPIASILGFATDMSIDRLLQLTNEKRAENGLGQLHISDRLAQAASAKAKDMFSKDYWAHFGPQGEGPWDFIIQSGYKYTYAGENLCKNFMTSGGCVDAWMNSPSHRENMLKGPYSDVGFAVVNGKLGGEDTTLVVQMFGAPAGQPIALAKAAQAETKLNVAVPTSTIAASSSPIPPSPTIEPTTLPVANVNEIPQKTTFAGVTKNTLLSQTAQFPFHTSQLLIILFLVALIFDFYYAYRLKVIRISGKHVAHFIFLAVILLSLFVIRKGVIL